MEQRQGEKLSLENEETYPKIELLSAFQKESCTTEDVKKRSLIIHVINVTSANVEAAVKTDTVNSEGECADVGDVDSDSKKTEHANDLGKDIASAKDSSKVSSKKNVIQPSEISVIETENNSGERSYECSVCTKCYKCKKSAEYHIKVQHKAYSLFCQVCGKAFKLRYDLDRHLNVHKGIRPFPCPECDKSFVCKSSQMRHRKLHHLIGDIYKCHNCDKTFRAQTDLKRHLLTHTGERPWSCDLCSKSFVSKSSLKVHEKIHDDSQKFSCEVCHKMFHIRTDLIRHKSTHTGDLRWECAICQKKYSGKSAVKRHIKDIHILGKLKYHKDMTVEELLDSITESSSDLKKFDAFAKYKEDNSVDNLLKTVDCFVIYKGDENSDSQIAD